jgi:putative membrane protein
MMNVMYGGWGGWGWMMLMPLLWVVALTGVIVWAAIMVAGRPAGRAEPWRESAQEILDRRFAAGEIDADAYTRARDLLAGRPPGSS